MQHAAMPWKEVAPGTHIKSQQDPFHKVMYLLAHFAPDQSSQSARLSTLVTHHTVTHTHTEISIMETARNNFQRVDSKNAPGGEFFLLAHLRGLPSCTGPTNALQKNRGIHP